MEQVGVTIPDEIDADTTGGLVVELIGRIPQVGERARLGRYEIRVLDAEPTRVRRVELIEVEPDAGGESRPVAAGGAIPTNTGPIVTTTESLSENPVALVQQSVDTRATRRRQRVFG